MSAKLMDITTDQEVVDPQAASEYRPRILLVDDDEMLLRSLHRILQPNYDVQCETNPYRALVALEDDGPFAVVVSDLTMPGLDGVELLEASYAHSPETPRILLTGNATLPASIEAVNRAHITNLVVKPVTSDELLRIMGAAVIEHGELVAEFNAGPDTLDDDVLEARKPSGDDAAETIRAGADPNPEFEELADDLLTAHAPGIDLTAGHNPASES